MYVQFYTKFLNKDEINYSYDIMGNRTNEVYARINNKGKVNYFKDFIYTTNNLNQYTNKSFSVQDSEGLVEDSEIPNTQEPESFFAESYEGQANSGAIIELDDTTETEPIVELNGKLIYDKNGNMIGNMLNNKRQYIYSYDYKNRLVKVEKTIYKTIEGSETNEVQEIVKIIQYKYDNLDRRIQKIFNNGSYRNYYYSNKDIILEENYTKPNTNGISKLKTSKYFINGNSIDDVLAMEKVDYKTRKITETYVNKYGVTKTRTINETYTETNTYFYHKNHLNSIVAITDNLGNILEEYEYDVFGKPYSKDILTGKVTNLKASSIGNTRLFTGREYERGLQLYYNRARYYNPELGRFISRDPIDIADDVNLYSYVGNSPVSYSDVLGLAKSMTADEFRIAFISAYDDYLGIKEKIYKSEGKYQSDFVKLSTEKQNVFFYEYHQKRNYARELHYSRNDYNVISEYNSNLPDTSEHASMLGWKKLYNFQSVLHQINVPEDEWNEKWVSSDGHSEVVFSYNTGLVVEDIEDMGTYNIFKPNNSNHITYDMLPYREWGNGWDDSSTIKQRKSWTRYGVVNNY